MQLDIIFAKGHLERRSPVAISKSDDIPSAGSREAEEILGRNDRAAEGSHEKGLSKITSRIGHKKDGQGDARHVERRFSNEA